MLKKIKIIVVLGFILSLINFKALAQLDYTIHLMQGVPQSVYTNPSFVPQCKWYIGFPALSSINLGVSNTGFTFKDLIHKRSQDDSLMIDPENVINKMGKRNYTSIDLNEEILAFGFKYKKLYVNFSATEKLNVKFCLPTDLLGLAWYGNGHYLDKTLDFKYLGLDAVHYREFALGVSYPISSKLYFGGRAKVLFGMSNVWFKESNMSFLTDGTDATTFNLTANSNLEINTSMPVNINHWDSVNVDFNAKDYFSNTKNMGGAIDLGATYRLNEKINLGLSILDFGYIHFNTSVQNFSNHSGSFLFDGVDITQFFNSNDTLIQDKMQHLLDSISKTFDLTEKNEDYWYPLNTKIYLTGMYSLTPKDKIVLLVRSEFFNSTIHVGAALSYNRRFFDWLSASLSYSAFNSYYTNVGLGFNVNIFPFQIYVVTDNLLAAIIPDKSKNAYVHCGLNFVFGYKTPKVAVPIL
jgi:hypothetical protein